MQGGAVLIPAPFPVCDGGLFCFPCFCPVSRAQRVPAPFPVCDGGLFCFPCFCHVSRMQRVPAPFPVLSRFPCAMGGLFCFPCFCLVSRMQRVPAPFPVLSRFPCAVGGLFCFRVSVSFPACSGFLPCSPCATRGSCPFLVLQGVSPMPAQSSTQLFFGYFLFTEKRK